MLFYLASKGLKYIVCYLEVVTLSQWMGKGRLFLFTDLVLHLCKIAFQSICLIRFTLYYNYPVFWVRDILISVVLSVEYVKKFIASLNMVQVVDNLPTISLKDKREECGICLQIMVSGTKLSCGHLFHRDCLL